jgi:osmotically-inducible protein OsmY
MEMARRFTHGIIALALVALLTGCAGGPESKSTGEYVDDAALTTKVKTALFRSDEVSGFDINVDTYKGRVQLNGFVDNNETKRRAAEIAREVNGVQEVINNLKLK